ncbi:MAG: DUF2846 domain-containing protein [Holophaga sp.]|nr:DUF2846 domain-containing protein [Holophaga sp.]
MNRLPAILIGLALTLSLAAQVPAPVPEAAPATPVAPARPSVPQAQPPAPTPAETAPVAEAPKYSEAVLKAIGPIVEGKGRMVFFRPGKFAGAGVGFIVREQDKELGKLRNGKYFVINAEPGKHTYSVHSEATDNSIVEVEAGETYFFSGSISMGFLVGHPHLIVSDAATFTAALPKLDPAAPLN